MQCVLLFIATIIACAFSETKVWTPKGQSVDEWYSHPIKCPKTALRFENDTLEFFEGYSHEREIIFAVTGYYIFQNNGQMVIGDSPHVQADDCKNSFGEEVLVHSVRPQPWASPDNWYSETNNNPAKPDIEKIPCDGDEIVFNTTVTRVDLTDIFRLQMSRVSIMDKWLKPRELGSFCKTVPGQKMFENCEYVEMMQFMAEPEIRACQSNADLMQKVVCDNVQCVPAKCESSIRPQGFCCDICGASASVEVHHNSNIKLNDLNGIISRKLAQVAPGAGISFHASFFNYETKFRLQLSLAERDEYSGESIGAMDKIANDLLRKRFGKRDGFLLACPIIMLPLFRQLGPAEIRNALRSHAKVKSPCSGIHAPSGSHHTLPGSL